MTDKAPSIASVFKKLQAHGFYQRTEHRTVKYLNNLIEQGHRLIKRQNKFYRAYEQPQPRLKAWKPFEDYIRRTEKKALSSGFQSARK